MEVTTFLTSALDLKIKVGLIKLVSATLPGIALDGPPCTTRRVLMASLLSLTRMASMSLIRDDGVSNTPPLPRMKLHLVEPHLHLHLNLDLAHTWLPVPLQFALLYVAPLQPAPDSLGCVSSTFIPICSLLNTVPLGFTFCPGLSLHVQLHLHFYLYIPTHYYYAFCLILRGMGGADVDLLYFAMFWARAPRPSRAPRLLPLADFVVTSPLFASHSVPSRHTISVYVLPLRRLLPHVTHSTLAKTST